MGGYQPKPPLRGRVTPSPARGTKGRSLARGWTTLLSTWGATAWPLILGEGKTPKTMKQALKDSFRSPSPIADEPKDISIQFKGSVDAPKFNRDSAQDAAGAGSSADAPDAVSKRKDTPQAGEYQGEWYGGRSDSQGTHVQREFRLERAG